MTLPTGYFNQYDASKGYTEVMALAGYVEQSREDNEIQAIFAGALKSTADTLYKNDSLVSGGDLGRGAGQFDYTVTDAKFYHNGRVFPVPAATLTLTGSGTETLGVLVTETYVGPNDDASLLDPASGSENYGQPGAWRRKVVCNWVLTNPNAATLYTFLSGVQQTQPVVGAIDVVTKTLARRTYDESGNYVVAGFDLSVTNRDTQSLNLVVGSGNATQGYNGSKAYVQGQEIIAIAPQKVALDRALDARSVVAQSFFFNNSTNLFAFPSQPAFAINRVTAIFDVVRTVTSHNYNGYDELILPGETLVSVVAAYHAGSPAAQTSPYVQALSQTGTGDYYLSGNGIKWDVVGSSTDPVTAGDTFYVYCLVKRVLDPSQYTITTTSGTTYFDLTPASPKPYNNNQVNSSNQTSEVDVDYQFYLSRIDTPYLSADGSIAVVKGSPEIAPVAKSAPGGTLALGQILLTAGTDASGAVVTQYATKRLTMEDLQKFLTRLTQTEYNTAVLNLDSAAQARAGNAITNLKGILTESFTYAGSDIDNDGVGGVSRIKFVRSATTPNTFDIENRHLTLPLHRGPWPLAPLGKTFTCPSTPGANMRVQLIATDTITVNPYGENSVAAYQTISIYPSGDSGMEMNTVTLATFDANSAAAQMMNTWQPNRATLPVPTAAPNQSGYLASANVYMADQWIFVKGRAFVPGSVLDVKIDGLAPNGFTLLASATAFPGLTPPIPARTLDASVTRVSPAVTFPGSTPDGNGVYPASSRPVVNANGEFDFFIRTPLDNGFSPARLPRAGAKNITVHSTAGDCATQVFQSNAARQLNFSTQDISTSVSSSLGQLIPPAAPKIASVVGPIIVTGSPSGTVGSTLTDIVAGGTVNASWTVTWDQVNGGTPAKFNLYLSNGVTVTRTIADAVGNSCVLTVNGINTACEWNVYLSTNGGGNSVPVHGSFTKVTLPPIVAAPSISSLTTSADFILHCQGYTSGIPATWSGLTGACTSISFAWSSSGGGGNTINVISPATSGTTYSPILGPGVVTLTATVTGPGGSTTKTTGFTMGYLSDPVAQTFRPDKDGFVDGVGVYFSQLPDSSKPLAVTDVRVEIRNVVNGYPGDRTQVVASGSAVMTRAQIVATGGASSDGSLETYFKFDTPPYLKGGINGKDYAVVVITDSKDYKLYYAKVGNNQIAPTGQTSPGPLTRQAYLDGAMFVSSNSNAWSALQDSDLKFRIASAVFTTGETVVNFDPITGTNMVGINVPVDFRLPTVTSTTGKPTTRIFLEYQLDGTGTWFALEPDTQQFFPSVPTSQVNLRARLQTDDPSVSPLISRSTGMTAFRLYRDLVGTYVTKTATYSSAYRNVRMICKMALPTGCTVRWFVSDNTAYVASVAAYASGTTYSAGTVVSNPDGSQWVALSTTVGNVPSTISAFWAPATVALGVLWRELPAAGQIITAGSDALFSEYERDIDLGASGGRTQFRFMLQTNVNSVANSIYTPRVQSVMTIANA